MEWTGPPDASRRYPKYDFSFTTLRAAVLAHDGEARRSREQFEALRPHERDAIIEFLKTLQVLPPGTKSLVVDENRRPKEWPPRHRRERF